MPRFIEMAIFTRHRRVPVANPTLVERSAERDKQLRGQIARLTAQNEGLHVEVRDLCVELCRSRLELCAVRDAHDWNAGLDDLTN